MRDVLDGAVSTALFLICAGRGGRRLLDSGNGRDRWSGPGRGLGGAGRSPRARGTDPPGRRLARGETCADGLGGEWMLVTGDKDRAPLGGRACLSVSPHPCSPPESAGGQRGAQAEPSRRVSPSPAARQEPGGALARGSGSLMLASCSSSGLFSPSLISNKIDWMRRGSAACISMTTSLRFWVFLHGCDETSHKVSVKK